MADTVFLHDYILSKTLQQLNNYNLVFFSMSPSWLRNLSFPPPQRWLGPNPIYEITDTEDIRLAFFRLTKCRNHKVHSALNAIMLRMEYNFILTMTRTVVQRALRGKHELVSLMLTEE